MSSKNAVQSVSLLLFYSAHGSVSCLSVCMYVVVVVVLDL